MSLDAVTALASRLNTENGIVMLFDGRGAPLVYPDKDAVAALKPVADFQPVAAALGGRYGSAGFRNPATHRDEFGASARVESTSWIAMATESQASSMATFNTGVTADLAGPRDADGLPTRYVRGPLFGRATSAGNYAAPREWIVAAGFRF